MFRMGGNAEGITSGLDTPKLNASRQGYEFGKTVENIKRDMPALRKLYEAEVAEATAIIDTFLQNSVGVADHDSFIKTLKENFDKLKLGLYNQVSFYKFDQQHQVPQRKRL